MLVKEKTSQLSALVLLLLMSACSTAQPEYRYDDPLPPQCKKDAKSGKISCELPSGCKYDPVDNAIKCKKTTGRCKGNACRELVFETENTFEKCLRVWNMSPSRNVKVTLKEKAKHTTKTLKYGRKGEIFDGQFGCVTSASYLGAEAYYR